MKQDLERLTIGARALAKQCGDRWEAIDEPARLHYQTEAAAVVAAVDAYDTHRHGTAVKAGHARSRAAGLRGPGQVKGGRSKTTIDTKVIAEARGLLLNGHSTREVRQITRLGNSSITKIRRALKGQADVRAAAPTQGDRHPY